MFLKELSVTTFAFIFAISVMSFADDYIQGHILKQNQTIHLTNPQPPMPSTSPLEDHFERERQAEYYKNWSNRKNTGTPVPLPYTPLDTFNTAPIDPNSEVGLILQNVLDTSNNSDSTAVPVTVEQFDITALAEKDIHPYVDTLALQREREKADSIRSAEEKAKDEKIIRSLQRYYIQYDFGIVVSRMRGDAIDEFEQDMDEITPIVKPTQSFLIHRAIADFLSIGTGLRFSAYGVHAEESFFYEYDEKFEFRFFQIPVIFTFSNFTPEKFGRKVNPFFSGEIVPSFLHYASAPPYMYESYDEYDKQKQLYGFSNGTTDKEIFRTFNLFTTLGGGIRLRLGNRFSFHLKTSYELSLLTVENIDEQTRNNFYPRTFSESTSRFHAFKFGGGLTFRFK